MREFILSLLTGAVGFGGAGLGPVPERPVDHVGPPPFFQNLSDEQKTELRDRLAERREDRRPEKPEGWETMTQEERDDWKETHRAEVGDRMRDQLPENWDEISQEERQTWREEHRPEKLKNFGQWRKNHNPSNGFPF